MSNYDLYTKYINDSSIALVVNFLDRPFTFLYIQPIPKQVHSAPGKVWRIQLFEKPA